MSCATFENISVISYGAVLLVDKIRESPRPFTKHRHTLLHEVVSSTPHYEQECNSHRSWWLVVIAYVDVNPTYIRTWSHYIKIIKHVKTIKQKTTNMNLY